MAAEPPEYLEVILMDSKGQLVVQELNQEWIELIKEAKELELTIEEIRKFLEIK